MSKSKSPRNFSVMKGQLAVVIVLFLLEVHLSRSSPVEMENALHKLGIGYTKAEMNYGLYFKYDGIDKNTTLALIQELEPTAECCGTCGCGICCDGVNYYDCCSSCQDTGCDCSDCECIPMGGECIAVCTDC